MNIFPTGENATGNINVVSRDAFETYTPGTNWTEVKGTGDLIYVDGNSAASSYLVISKSPLYAGTDSSISSIKTATLPVELDVGFSMSQRTLGQDVSIELTGPKDPLPNVPDLAISAITQTASVLTVDTVVPHGLTVGTSIGIFGCSNSIVNYPSLVVATTPTPNQFTVLAGPGGAISSATITNPSGAKGFVYFRERMSRAQNGMSEIFESSVVTTASLYIRSQAGDVMPSGTISGIHGVQVATTASVQLVNAAYNYAFGPFSEFQFLVQYDRTQWADQAVDSVAQTTSRLLRTQVCPDPSVDYTLRFRAVNNKGLTVPNAQIVSAVKTGTTTGTITTDVAHGLAAGELVTIYGIRDHIVFPPMLTATAVASIVSATSFTIVIGTAGTATSNGGLVARVNGGNLPSALGYNPVAAQSATLSTLSDGVRQLVLVGNTNWAGLKIGDLVELYGVRDIVIGATIGVDGAWKVANVATTSLTLVMPYPNSLVIPADFALTSCGGSVILRTDARISFARLTDYERERVELLPRPVNDMSAATPVVIQGGTLAAVTTVTTVSSVGSVSLVGSVTSAGTPLTPATPFFVNSLATTNGALILTGTSGLQAFFASNIGATVAFVKLYNKATAPVVGTDVPEMVITVPATGQVEISPGFNGYRFVLGLGIAITGLAADTDTTAVAAGQVKVKLSRTV